MEAITDAQSLAATVAAMTEGGGEVGGEAPALPPTSRVGRYLVLGTLGEGGMGVVHAAYDPELDRKVALKVLLPGRGGRAKGHERLLREAQSLARLSHPNVVAVHDVGTHEGRVFVAMEFIAGTTLSATIESQRPGLEAIVGLYAAAGRGLEAAHRVGLVHRDFKPKSRPPRPERP
ncbi:MAG TPA: serine/threonine-protein kinase, partial [Nannocystaceae bacterium]|nr:serine/threonine-protein kinase [Nannocystaceae bacterium]